ncbi:hypothetical protein RhiirA4_478456 [Rhizophagus irregularis]|uniref:F-box domain-containing protein n=1 Tax=Rhizophagus irregularis TaxID=588596 RepID=A0A2I1HET3_9GLOM|nr:hypothetical protein RhiirA4_478456 [Rhizophagus irregularis]
MPSPILPAECFRKILNLLDNSALYNCLFLNRYYCRVVIPIIWQNPFVKQIATFTSCSLINTILSCFDEDEILSLIPSSINLNTQPPLFAYVEFIKKINHDCLVEHVRTSIESSNGNGSYLDCEVQKLANAIYNRIFRKNTAFQEFEANVTQKNYVDLPKFSVFTNYEPGIRRLRSLTIFNLDLISSDRKRQNTSKFLDMVPKSCDSIVNLELWIKSIKSIFVKKYLDIIKSQPLKRIFLYIDSPERITYNLELEFRSETLKELILDSVDFKQISLSFIPKLKHLERLEFLYCKGFNNCVVLSNSKLYLKKFKLWYCEVGDLIEEIIYYLCNESLLKLTLSNATTKAVQIVKESCPNINYFCIRFYARTFSDSIIPFICDLTLLNVLNIGSNFGIDMVSLVKNFGNYLIYIECLFFDFNIDLQSFIYFTNNCKANLKYWIITLENNSSSKEYLLQVCKFQNIHNSLKTIGIKKYGDGWMKEELEIIDILKNQGINIVTPDELNYLFC